MATFNKRQKLTMETPDEPVHLTKNGLLRMRNRLAELIAELPKLIDDAAQAAAQGDRSDNDAYKQSKSILRRTHRQIWTIEDQLKRIVMIQPGRNPAGTVQLGSVVTVKTKDGTQTFEIIGSQEADPGRGRISHESPIGHALLGHVEGDTVTIQAPNGAHTHKIVKIV